MDCDNIEMMEDGEIDEVNEVSWNHIETFDYFFYLLNFYGSFS